MAVTGAAWCEFVVYEFKDMSIQRTPFDQEFWGNISQKLKLYYFQHFLAFAIQESKDQENDPRLTRL